MTKIDGIEHAKKLWILEQVLETGSFRAAARKAKVSAPAISQALSNLERLVGKPLVIRRDGKVLATETAEQLLSTAKPAIQALRELAIRMEPASVPNIAWISFGAFESLAIDLLPKLSTQLQTKLPKLKLTLRIASNAALARMVRGSEICAALVEENDNLGRLSSIAVGSDRLGCYARYDAKSPLTLPFGTTSSGDDGHPLYYTKFVKAAFGDAPRPFLVSDSYEALRSSAAHGSVMAILPHRVAERIPGELVEVTPASAKAVGRHDILLISQPNCDPEEIQFLASEVTPLLTDGSHQANRK